MGVIILKYLKFMRVLNTDTLLGEVEKLEMQKLQTGIDVLKNSCEV